MATEVWFVDAFTEIPLTGNRAGVVPNALGLTDEQMQRIAGEVNASETVFVLPASNQVADLRLRYFTKEVEVDLCGHGTIGAICGLLKHGVLANQQGSISIETNAGIFPVRYGQERTTSWVEMGQASPVFRYAPIEPQTIADLLGISASDIDITLPLGMCSTGLWDLFVPVVHPNVVCAMEPRLNELARWNRELGVVSTHVYARGALDVGNDFHTRDFAPSVGIPEDPCTGTATGALLALLHQHQFVDVNREYRFEQGYEVKRAGVIVASIRVENGGPGVYVRGSAVTSMKGHLRLK